MSKYIICQYVINMQIQAKHVEPCTLPATLWQPLHQALAKAISMNHLGLTSSHEQDMELGQVRSHTSCIQAHASQTRNQEAKHKQSAGASTGGRLVVTTTTATAVATTVSTCSNTARSTQHLGTLY
jgi:hypothetical protein